MERTVRPCGPRHAVVVGTMLAQAFLDDPVMHWLQPLRSRRAAMLRRLFVVQLSHEYLTASGVQMISDHAGQPLAAAMWKPPDTAGSRTSRREQVAMTAGVVAALRTRVPAALTLRGALERPPRRAALVSEQARHRASGPGAGFGLGPAQCPAVPL